MMIFKKIYQLKKLFFINQFWYINCFTSYTINVRKLIKRSWVMKTWIKWLSECEYKFVRTDDGTGDARDI